MAAAPRNQAWRTYSRALIMENKWRASRYGIDGALIDCSATRSRSPRVS
ncbi:MAG: hypothetical protein R2708_12675 [Vicinamibacterales bacterium]